MPAPPELLQAGRDIRVIEILRKAEAEQQRDTDGNVGIAGEIEIDLESETIDRQQYRCGIAAGHVVPDRVGGGRERIREHHLLHEAEHDQRDRVRDLLPRQALGMVEFVEELAGAHDRAGHQLREERDEQSVVEQAAARLEFAAVHVDGVAHALECVERDADRQQHIDGAEVQRTAGCCRDVVGAGDHEIRVLEEGKHAQVADHADRDQSLRLQGLREMQPDPVVEHGREQDQAQVLPVPRRVEVPAGQQQDPLVQCRIATHRRHHRVHDEEEQDERPGIEIHRDRIRRRNTALSRLHAASANRRQATGRSTSDITAT